MAGAKVKGEWIFSLRHKTNLLLALLRLNFAATVCQSVSSEPELARTPSTYSMLPEIFSYDIFESCVDCKVFLSLRPTYQAWGLVEINCEDCEGESSCFQNGLMCCARTSEPPAEKLSLSSLNFDPSHDGLCLGEQSRHSEPQPKILWYQYSTPSRMCGMRVYACIHNNLDQDEVRCQGDRGSYVSFFRV